MASGQPVEHLARGLVPTGLPLPSERLISLLEIASDWYWEQDENFRFTELRGRSHKPPVMGVTNYIGATRWEHGEVPVTDAGDWGSHKATLAAHQPFSNFVLKRVNREGELRFISSSGVPLFDENGRFRGYCGVAKDVTAAVRDEMRVKLQYGVTEALAQSDSVRHMLGSVLRVFCEVFGWEGGSCFGLVEATDSVHCLETWSKPGSELSALFDQLRTGGPLPATLCSMHVAWIEQRPVWLDELTSGLCVLARAEVQALGLRGAFCVPVMIDGKVAGVLELLSRSRVIPDPGMIDRAALLGSQIGEFYRRVQAQERLRRSEERFRHLVELSSDWYWEQDDQFRFTKLEGQGGAVPFAEVRGKTRWQLPIVATEAQWAEHKALLDARQPFRDFEYEVITADGDRKHHSVNGLPVFDRHGTFRGYHGMTRDITARKRADERIQYLATHDALTSLPNRSMFASLLDSAIASAARYDRHFAVIFVDLDRFKLINDTLGHDAGDALLKEVAVRLANSLRESDVVARLGGDEFVVLVQEINDARQAAAVARKILDAVMKPVTLCGQECRVTASVGICMYPTDAKDEQSLMKSADMAMYLAKDEGKNNFQFFTADIKAQTLERLAMESALRQAIERGEMFLHYQARLDLRSGSISGAEALLRWVHPELGMVSPATFIPLAEETGFIVSIGRWVLQTACAQNVSWQRQGLPALRVAVNLSPRQFHDANLLGDITQVLRHTGMRADQLELEITEGTVMQDVQRTARILSEIKALGISLAIDDFGTGYSSLAQIKRFPLDTIKIDRSFVRNLPHDVEDKAITQAIIALGRTLGSTVVAEGVETAAQEDFLREQGCDETQGYYFSRPVASEQFIQLVLGREVQAGSA